LGQILLETEAFVKTETEQSAAHLDGVSLHFGADGDAFAHSHQGAEFTVIVLNLESVVSHADEGVAPADRNV